MSGEDLRRTINRSKRNDLLRSLCNRNCQQCNQAFELLTEQLRGQKRDLCAAENLMCFHAKLNFAINRFDRFIEDIPVIELD
jgi:hypothetical protein